MLVLSRKLGESITIGDDIVVHVRRITRGRVALAIDAPRHVPVLRTEVEKSDLATLVPDPEYAALPR